MKKQSRNIPEVGPTDTGKVLARAQYFTNRPISDKIPFRLRQEIQIILDQKSGEYAQSEKQVGTLRREKRSDVIFDFFSILWGLRFKIESLCSLKQKHIKAVVQEWERCGQATSTLLDKISIIRTFCQWIDKPGMVGNAGDYLRDPSSAQIGSPSDNSWEAQGIEPTIILRQVMEKDVNVGTALELCLEFGLRPREVISLNIKGAQDCGSLIVREKANGGHVRAIPIEKESQRNALNAATANLDKHGTIRIRGETDAQRLRRFYYVLECVGVTKKQLGITATGARDQYFNDPVHASSGDGNLNEGNKTHRRYRSRNRGHGGQQPL